MLSGRDLTARTPRGPGLRARGVPEARPSPLAPIRFLQLSSPGSGPRRVRPWPLAGRARPSHAPPERRLPEDRHVFLDTDTFLGVTPIASGYDVGQRPVVHRLQSLPRPLREGTGAYCRNGPSDRPPERADSRSSPRGPLFQRASTAWGTPAGRATDKVAFWRACRRGRPRGQPEGVCTRSGGGLTWSGPPARTSLSACLLAFPSFIDPPHPFDWSCAEKRVGVAYARRTYYFFGARTQEERARASLTARVLSRAGCLGATIGPGPAAPAGVLMVTMATTEQWQCSGVCWEPMGWTPGRSPFASPFAPVTIGKGGGGPVSYAHGLAVWQWRTGYIWSELAGTLHVRPLSGENSLSRSIGTT